MTANQDELERLYLERELAGSAKRYQADFIEPFFDAKLDELFKAFCAAPIGSTDALVQLHHQFKSLNALYESTRPTIETGKMADARIAELEAQNSNLR